MQQAPQLCSVNHAKVALETWFQPSSYIRNMNKTKNVKKKHLLPVSHNRNKQECTYYIKKKKNEGKNSTFHT